MSVFRPSLWIFNNNTKQAPQWFSRGWSWLGQLSALHYETHCGLKQKRNFITFIAKPNIFTLFGTITNTAFDGLSKYKVLHIVPILYIKTAPTLNSNKIRSVKNFLHNNSPEVDLTLHREIYCGFSNIGNLFIWSTQHTQPLNILQPYYQVTCILHKTLFPFLYSKVIWNFVFCTDQSPLIAHAACQMVYMFKMLCYWNVHIGEVLSFWGQLILIIPVLHVRCQHVLGLFLFPNVSSLCV